MFKLGQVPKRQKESVGPRAEDNKSTHSLPGPTEFTRKEIFGSAERPIRRKTPNNSLITVPPIFRVETPSPLTVTGARNSFGKFSPLVSPVEVAASLRRSRSFPPDNLETRLLAVEKRNRVLEQIVVALVRGAMGSNRRSAKRESSCLDDILNKQEEPMF